MAGGTAAQASGEGRGDFAGLVALGGVERVNGEVLFCFTRALQGHETITVCIQLIYDVVGPSALQTFTCQTPYKLEKKAMT